MIEQLEPVLAPILAITAVLYLGLAVHVARSAPKSIIAFFLLLIGTMIAGSAFSFGTQDSTIYGIGRTLSYFAGSFMPVAFYLIYRQYTDRPAATLMVTILSIIPIATSVLALTNPMHQMMWSPIFTETGVYFTEITSHDWFQRVHGPYTYGLLGFSLIALAARLPSIAPAHRRPVMLLIACAILPLGISIANTLFGLGPADFPFLSSTLAMLLPIYAYVSVSMRVYEFSPIAYQTLFDHVRDPIIVLDNDQRVICVNAKAAEMLGTTESAMLGRQLWEDFPDARAALNQARELDLTQTMILNPDQTYEISVAPLLDKRGETQGTVVVCRDVTERRKALSQLADSEHLIRTLIETSSNGILRFARDDNDERRPFRCIFANRAAESYLSEGKSTLVGMPLEKLKQLNPQRLLEHFGDADRPSSALSFETSTESEEEEGWLRIVGEPVGEDFSVTVIDITQRKRNEDKMLADALRDPLTGVLNRRGFEKEAAASIRSENRGAVLYLDLNHFKSINDRFGHQAGDALLKAFGHRLEFCLRPEDILGRLGGDEFAIVLPGVSIADAKHIAERLVITASEAYIIQGQEIKCTASVGISLMPQHGEELWHLISVADQAMYKAKAIPDEEAANDRAAYVEAAIAL